MHNLNSQTDLFIDKVRDTIASILEQGYYVDIFMSVEHTKPLEECTKSELLEPFQRMWERLPDTPYIRWGPFGSICDLAEEYMFGDEPPEDWDTNEQEYIGAQHDIQPSST